MDDQLWVDIENKLKGSLCYALKNRVVYVLEKNKGLRGEFCIVKIHIDRKDLVCFVQPTGLLDMDTLQKSCSSMCDNEESSPPPCCDTTCEYMVVDFPGAVDAFFGMDISAALTHQNHAVKALALLDVRVSGDMLRALPRNPLGYPKWLAALQSLRITVEGINYSDFTY